MCTSVLNHEVKQLRVGSAVRYTSLRESLIAYCSVRSPMTAPKSEESFERARERESEKSEGMAKTREECDGKLHLWIE